MSIATPMANMTDCRRWRPQGFLLERRGNDQGGLMRRREFITLLGGVRPVGRSRRGRSSARRAADLAQQYFSLVTSAPAFGSLARPQTSRSDRHFRASTLVAMTGWPSTSVRFTRIAHTNRMSMHTDPMWRSATRRSVSSPVPRRNCHEEHEKTSGDVP